MPFREYKNVLVEFCLQERSRLATTLLRANVSPNAACVPALKEG